MHYAPSCSLCCSCLAICTIAPAGYIVLLGILPVTSKLHCVGAGGQEAWEGGVHTATSRKYVLAQYMRLEPKYIPEELCTPAELRCVLTPVGDTWMLVAVPAGVGVHPSRVWGRLGC